MYTYTDRQAHTDTHSQTKRQTGRDIDTLTDTYTVYQKTGPLIFSTCLTSTTAR